MKYLNDDSDFLGVYAWNEGKLNKTESQIFLLEKQFTSYLYAEAGVANQPTDPIEELEEQHRSTCLLSSS